MYGHSSQLAAFTTVTGTGFFFTGAHIAAIAIMAVTLVFVGLVLTRLFRKRYGRP
jgi:hypothetical protein